MGRRDNNLSDFWRFWKMANLFYKQAKVNKLRPSSDAVLHMSRIECKWAKSFVLPHLHSIRLVWSTASELGLSDWIISYTAKCNTDLPKVFKFLCNSPYGKHWKCRWRLATYCHAKAVEDSPTSVTINARFQMAAIRYKVVITRNKKRFCGASL